MDAGFGVWAKGNEGTQYEEWGSGLRVVWGTQNEDRGSWGYFGKGSSRPSSFSPPWKACHCWDWGWERGGGGGKGVTTRATREHHVIYSVFLLLRF